MHRQQRQPPHVCKSPSLEPLRPIKIDAPLASDGHKILDTLKLCYVILTRQTRKKVPKSFALSSLGAITYHWDLPATLQCNTTSLTSARECAVQATFQIIRRKRELSCTELVHKMHSVPRLKKCTRQYSPCLPFCMGVSKHYTDKISRKTKPAVRARFSLSLEGHLLGTFF